MNSPPLEANQELLAATTSILVALMLLLKAKEVISPFEIVQMSVYTKRALKMNFTDPALAKAAGEYVDALLNQFNAPDAPPLDPADF